MGLDLSTLSDILENSTTDIKSSTNATNELLVDEIMMLMGYNKKRIRGIHRLYDHAVDWEIEIGARKRFAIRTLALGTPIDEQSVSALATFCTSNNYPYGFMTDGNIFKIVSNQPNDDQPILEFSIFSEPDRAAEILSKYAYTEFNERELKEYYEQFQVTVEKLAKRLALLETRKALCETIFNILKCKDTAHNREMIKGYIDKALDQMEQNVATIGEKMGNVGAGVVEQGDGHGELDTEPTGLKVSAYKLNISSDISEETLSTLGTDKAELDLLHQQLSEARQIILELTEKLSSGHDETKPDEIGVDGEPAEFNETESDFAETEPDEIGVDGEPAEFNETESEFAETEPEFAETAEFAETEPDFSETEPEFSETEPEFSETSTEPSGVTVGEPFEADDIEGETTELEPDTSEPIDTEPVNHDTPQESHPETLPSNTEQSDTIQDMKLQIDKLGRTNERLCLELDELRKLRVISTDSVDLKVGDVDNVIVETLVAENQILKSQIDAMINNDNLSDCTINFAKEVEQYRNKITELYSENCNLRAEIEKHKVTIEELTLAISSKESEELSNANELLDTIQDNPEQPRSYIAVIGNKLFQEGNLKKFIGRCIESLYPVSSLSLLSSLYDSDNFHLQELSSTETDYDFMLGLKKFSLDLSSDTEESALLKIKALFQLYPNVIYVYKTTGTLESGISYKEEQSDNEPDLLAPEETDIGETDSTTATNINDPTNPQDIEFSETERSVVSLTLANANGTLNLANATCNSIESVVIEHIDKTTADAYYTTYTISETGAESKTEQASTAIQALLVSNEFPDTETSLQWAISTFNSLETRMFNELLVKDPKGNSSYTKIPLTNYYIAPIETTSDLLFILSKVGYALGYDLETVQLICNITYTLPNQAIEPCIIDPRTIQTSYQNVDCTITETDTTKPIKIYGNITDQVILTKNSLSIQNELFKAITRMATSYMNVQIETEAQFISAVSTMLSQAVMNRRKIDYKGIGKAIGSDKYILSPNKSEVTEKHVQVKTNTQVYYVSQLEPAQQIYALIKINKFVTGTKQINFTLSISDQAYDFYKYHFRSKYPALDLIVKSIITYLDHKY